MSKYGPLVGITDIILHGTSNFTKDDEEVLCHPSVGECNDLDADETTQLDRLYDTIKDVMDLGFQEYSYNCDDDGNLPPLYEGDVVRVVTNEFCFYTKTPLSIAEFESLQQRISDYAKTQPQNLHLILASFAVKTPDNKVMNVVTQLQCGSEPKFDFIVKNHPSEIDPIYRGYHNNRKKTMKNVKIGEDDISGLKVTIDNKECAFTFNNIKICQAQNNGKYLSCIDICLDHKLGVAKQSLAYQIEDLARLSSQGQSNIDIPMQCSHVVTSNWTPLVMENTIGIVTHADPVMSPQFPKGSGSIDYDNRGDIKTAFGPNLQKVATYSRTCDFLSGSNLHYATFNNTNVANQQQGKPLEPFQPYIPPPSDGFVLPSLPLGSIASSPSQADSDINKKYPDPLKPPEEQFSNPFGTVAPASKSLPDPFKPPEEQFSNPFGSSNNDKSIIANPPEQESSDIFKTNVNVMMDLDDKTLAVHQQVLSEQMRQQEVMAFDEYDPNVKPQLDAEQAKSQMLDIATAKCKQNDIDGVIDLLELSEFHEALPFGDDAFKFQNQEDRKQFCQLVQSFIDNPRLGSDFSIEDKLKSFTGQNTDAMQTLQTRLNAYIDSHRILMKEASHEFNAKGLLSSDNVVDEALLSSCEKAIAVMQKHKEQLQQNTQSDKSQHTLVDAQPTPDETKKPKPGRS